MRYRIVSNGDKFRVQFRYRFWPFWFTVDQTLDFGAWCHREFLTYEAAWDFILKERKRKHQTSKPWQPVNKADKLKEGK